MTQLLGTSVLLVEDVYLIARMFKGALERAGATVLGPAPTVDAAMSLIDDHQGKIDVAILDVNLGHGTTSYRIADRLNELGVPFVFATGEIRIEQNERYQHFPSLEKPILEAELIQAIVGLPR